MMVTTLCLQPHKKLHQQEISFQNNPPKIHRKYENSAKNNCWIPCGNFVFSCWDPCGRFGSKRLPLRGVRNSQLRLSIRSNPRTKHLEKETKTQNEIYQTIFNQESSGTIEVERIYLLSVKYMLYAKRQPSPQKLSLQLCFKIMYFAYHVMFSYTF